MQINMIIASFLLFANVLLLTILVPGGPIENRDFTGLTGVVFWGFNVFLISLGISSFVTCYFLLTSSHNSLFAAQVISILYFIVYMVDLGGIFPKSPTKMSKKLMLLEIINASMAVFLFIFVTAAGRVV